MDQFNSILDTSEALFFRVGIKSITMDDIARELGMSKKTLYVHVKNKKDLVEKVIQRYIANEASFAQNINIDTMNAIDIIVEIINHVHKSISNLPHSAIYDLQKYYPKSWKLFIDFKNQFVFNTMVNIIQKGKIEGLFRKTINERLIAKFYVIAVDGTLNPVNFKDENISFKDIYLEYIIYHLHGLVSTEGKKYLKTIKLNNE
ncbi:MAG: TetR/AcrR family transcriptional regulator [Chitinophagales bacterium]